MPTMIPDFARAITESNRQATHSADEEIRRVDGLLRLAGDWKELEPSRANMQRRIAREARAATRKLIADVQEVTVFWDAALGALRSQLPTDEQIRILHASTELVAGQRGFLNAVGRLWDSVERWGGQRESAEEIAAAARLLDCMEAETIGAREARTNHWQPIDPARFERGRQEILSGKAIGPDEARTRFRSSPA